jgi:hypothetical protein
MYGRYGSTIDGREAPAGAYGPPFCREEPHARESRRRVEGGLAEAMPVELEACEAALGWKQHSEEHRGKCRSARPRTEQPRGLAALQARGHAVMADRGHTRMCASSG